MKDKYAQFLDLIDDIDAAVFSGDTLEQNTIRNMFIEAMQRWSREVGGRKVKLTYFNTSGKYYTDGEYNSLLEHDFEIYEEVMDKVNEKNLEEIVSGSWDGYILVEPENGVPALVIC